MDLVPIEKVVRRVPIRSKPAYRKPVLELSQLEMFPLSLDERLGPNEVCRFVSALVDLVDIAVLTEKFSATGAPSYHPALLLKLWMFAFLDKNHSSRGIEKSCRYDDRYRWLCRGLIPDHATLCRFRHRAGKIMDKLLAESVRIGRQNGMGFGRACLDGTKIPGTCSQWRKYRDEAEVADKDLALKPDAEGEAEFAGTAEIAPADPVEASVPGPARELKQAATTQICATPVAPPSAPKAELVPTQAPASKSRRKRDPKIKRVRLPSSDPEARTMRTRQGQFIEGYNAQALVDSDDDLILAVHVSNDSSDAHLQDATLDKCLELHGSLPDEFLADAGYDSPLNAQSLESLGIKAWVPGSQKTFWTVDEQDRPVCPMGHVPTREEHFKKKGIPVTRLCVEECPTCPIRLTCLSKTTSTTKMICFDSRAQPGPWIRLRIKSSTPEGKQECKQRGKTVELAFARIKQIYGFRRLTLTGLDGAREQIGMVALAMNFATLAKKMSLEELKRLLAHVSRLLRALLALQRRPSSLCNQF